MGSESTYYRLRRGEYPLDPEMQTQLLEKIKEKGGNPAVGFDRYADEIVFVRP